MSPPERRPAAPWLAVLGLAAGIAATHATAAEPPSRTQWPATPDPGGQWDACLDLPAMPTRTGDGRARRDPDLATHIESDRMRYQRGTGTYAFDGNVTVERADQWLRADELLYRQMEERIDARGELLYGERGLRLFADQGYLELGRDRGELDGARYLVPETLAQGESDKIELRDADVVRLSRATYSTCEPGNELWQLRVSRLRLNRETGVGEAWDARMAIAGTPVAYIPYMNFPIDDRRKSGLLPPTFRQSERTGTDFTQPYYWNIAPNYDATISPRYMSQRGSMVHGEFRYLQQRHSGEFQGAYLPDDDQLGEDRWALSIDQRARIARGVSASLDFNRVSDEDYFRDFGSTFDQSSVSHLRSRGQVRHRRGDWDTRARADWYQTLSPTIAPRNRPYERLPQVRMRYTPWRADVGPVALDYRLDAEAVRFDHPEPDLRDTGTRLDLTPRLSVPYERQAGFVRPTLALRHTQYDLDRVESEGDETFSRTTPITSLDTGIYLERHFQAFDRSLRQTLEPRAYYLHVPYRDQDDIPRFDTSRAQPTLFQFFSENRFIGADRVGDANQVTLSLTSRFLDRTSGEEYFRVGVGQIRHFRDREVQLRADDPIDETSRSEIIGETRARLPAGFSVGGEAVWDQDTEETRFASLRVNYQPRRDAVISTAYRARRDNGELSLEQRDLAVVWPVLRRWHVIGGWRYSMLEDRTLEAFGGLQYRDCCWSIRLVNRYYREDAGEEPERSVMLQFEFRGLGSIGDRIEDFLEDTIYGYQDLR